MTKRIIAACLLLATAGCEHIKYTTNAAPSGPTSDEKWHHNFVYFVEKDAVDMSKECPGGQFASVDHQIGMIPALVLVGAAVVTSFVGLPNVLGIVWQPSTYKVTCSAGGGEAGGGQVPPPPPSGVPSS